MILDWIFVVLNLFILFLLFASFDRRAFFNLSIAAATFIVEYFAASNLFLALNSFSVLYCLVAVFVLNVFVAAFRCINNRNDFIKGIKQQNYKIDVVVFILILASVAFSWKTNGNWGVTQDEGVYSTAGIIRAYDYPNMSLDFSREIEFIDEESGIDAINYRELFRTSQVGFYLNEYDYFTDEAVDNDSFSGVFHGLPAYPCFLGLSAQLFGLENMLFINHFITLLQGVFLAYLLDNLKVKKYLKWAAFILCSVSPVLIWVNKSSLTENIFTMFFIMLFAAITSDNKKFKYFVYSIACWGICLVHFSAYVYMPLIGALLIYEAIKENKAEPVVWAEINGLIFSVCHLYAEVYSSSYTIANYSNLIKSISPIDNFFLFGVYAALGVTIFLMLVGLLFFIKAIRQKLNEFINSKIFTRIMQCAIVGVLVFAAYKTFKNYFKGIYTIGQAISHSTFYGIALLTGIVILPLAVLMLIAGFNRIKNNQHAFIFALAFIYMVIAQVAFFRVLTDYYYYYSRYLVPLLFLVVVSAIIFMPKWKVSSVVMSLLMIGGTVFLAPYSWYVMKTQDDTLIQYNEIIEIASEFKEGDAVVIDREVAHLMLFQIKVMTNADVYIMPGNSGTMLSNLSDNYDNVYFVTSRERSNYEEIKSIDNYYSYDMQPYRSVKLFPKDDFNIGESSFYIYKIDYPQVMWDIVQNTNEAFDNQEEVQLYIGDLILYGGFHPDEQVLAWTSENFSQFAFYVPENFSQEDVAFVLFSSKIWPRDAFPEYVVTISVNGENPQQFDLSDNGSCCLNIEDGLVPGEYNVISVESTLWVPAMYGQAEARSIGTALGGVLLQNH